MSDRAPAYRDSVSHFDALCLVALHEGGRIEECLATGNEREMLMRRACACKLSPRSPLLLENSLQPTPSPLCELAWRYLLSALLYVFGE